MAFFAADVVDVADFSAAEPFLAAVLPVPAAFSAASAVAVALAVRFAVEGFLAVVFFAAVPADSSAAAVLRADPDAAPFRTSFSPLVVDVVTRGLSLGSAPGRRGTLQCN